MIDTPQLTHEEVAEIAQEHEAFLTQLEGLAIIAIASGDWTQFEQLVNDFQVTQGTEETTSTNEQLAGLWAIAMTNDQKEDLLTEAPLAIRKLQIAYPCAYQQAEAALTSILVLKTRLKALEADSYCTSQPVKR